MRRLIASGLLGISLSACGLFPGDPGGRVAVQGSGSDNLGAILLLLCPKERVLSVTISEDVGKGGEIKPGRVLWRIEALQPSTESEFVPATELIGFQTVVAAPPSIAGDIVISVKATGDTEVDGIRVRPLPKEVVRFNGREMTKSAFFAKRKDVC